MINMSKRRETYVIEGRKKSYAHSQSKARKSKILRSLHSPTEYVTPARNYIIDVRSSMSQT